MKKILVIDDNKLHRDAAVAQLGAEHELTVVGTYDEGQELLGYVPVHGKSTHAHDYDVVLCDLLMPPSGQQQVDDSFMRKEMPVGIFLALLACKNATKLCLVGLLTDTNHHYHPGSACLDALYDNWDEILTPVGKHGRLTTSNHPYLVAEFLAADLSKPARDRMGKGIVPQEAETVEVKHWKGLLEKIQYLVAEQKQ
jgi:CheY-like chemotaxis protein